MNPESVSILARRGVELGTRVQGIRVQFRGKTMRVRVSQDAPTLDLGAGGFAPKQVWKLRFSALLQPPPREKETVLNLETGRTYVLTAVTPSSGSPSSCEHLATAVWQ